MKEAGQCKVMTQARSSQTVEIMETGTSVVQNTEARSSQVVDKILSQEAMQ